MVLELENNSKKLQIVNINNSRSTKTYIKKFNQNDTKGSSPTFTSSIKQI